MTRKAYDHGGKTRQQRGYGRDHDQMRKHLMATVILCEECQRASPPRVTIGSIADHIVPLAKGGTGDRSNYQLLCPACAREKDARDRGAKAKPRKGCTADGAPLDPDSAWAPGPGKSLQRPGKSGPPPAFTLN